MSDLLKHALVADIKRVTGDLGHIPKRDEYRSLKDPLISGHLIEKLFSSWEDALNAAGLYKTPNKTFDPISVKPLRASKIDSELISRSILVVGDTHFPFVHEEALCALYAFCEKFKPKQIVQVGDLYDMLAHSKFPRSLKTYDPIEEMELGFKMAKEMWATLQKLSPGCECHQLLGNHDVRPIKRLIERYPEAELFFNYLDYYNFDGVKTQPSDRDPLILNDILFHHGYMSRLGAHKEHFLMNTVCGHTHKGGVVFRNTRSGLLWELNAGLLGDPESKALSYTPSKITQWTLGWGYIDEYGPRFIPK